MCKPRIAYFTGHFEWATVTNTVSTPSRFTFRKSVKPSNFDCLSKLQNSIKLDIDKYVTTRTLLCKCLPHLLSYFNLYLSLSHSLPCNHPSLCYLYLLPDASDHPHSETCVLLHFRKRFWTFYN